MQVIGRSTIMVYDSVHDHIVNDSSDQVKSAGLPISADEGHPVSSYRDLLKKVAALSYHNSRFQILFRGQTQDYKRKERIQSSLYPSIFRHPDRNRGELPDAIEISYKTLNHAEELLKERMQNQDIYRNQIVRWAALQHYEVCATPLLDLTGSLQTALTFATVNRDDGWLYVFGFPHLNGAVSVSVDSGTQLVNLTQVCPPEALRPHFQQGFLASDYPLPTNYSTHSASGMAPNNFSCRLLTKFRLENCESWKAEGFSPLPPTVLFPNDVDEWHPIMEDIKAEIE